MERVKRAQTISSGAPSKTKEQVGGPTISEEQELKKTNHLENLSGKTFIIMIRDPSNSKQNSLIDK